MAARDPFRWRQGGHRFRDFVSQLLGPIAGCPISNNSVAVGSVTGGITGGPIIFLSVTNGSVAGGGPVASVLKRVEIGHHGNNIEDEDLNEWICLCGIYYYCALRNTLNRYYSSLR